MAIDYGIKVMKEGYGVGNTDIRNISMSSKHNMLKFHSENSASITLHPGDTNEYVDITHNLGYTPAFISYFKSGNDILNINALASTTSSIYTWADSSKVRVGRSFYSGAQGYEEMFPSETSDYYDDAFATTGYFYLGKKDGTARNGAIRVPSVPFEKDATIQSATLKLYVGSRGASNGNFKLKTWGIDEDDTAAFSAGSSPMGRPTTDAVHEHNFSPLNSAGQYVDVDVTNHVREITTRSGWAYGNAMGFVMRDNGSDDNVWLFDMFSETPGTYLTITGGDDVVWEFRVIIFKDKLA